MRRILVLVPLVALPVMASLVLAACAGDTEQVTTATAGPAAQHSQGSGTTVTLLTPVSGPSPVTALMYPTSVSLGDGRIEGSVTYRGAAPRDLVLVTISSLLSDFHYGVWARDSYVFEDLAPGTYRLCVSTWDTGYISQYFGGLACQGHTIEESKTAEVTAGVTRADFVLEPGRSIAGRVRWSGGPLQVAWVFVFDEHGQPLETTTCYAETPEYLFVGLVPAQYRVGATAGTRESCPLWDTDTGAMAWLTGGDAAMVWYGGGESLQEAAIVDLTGADAGGIDIDLGTLSPPVSTTIPQTTVSAPTATGAPTMSTLPHGTTTLPSSTTTSRRPEG